MMLMLDCYMAWDVAYTIDMARRLERYEVYWIEESLPPDDYRGYGEINREIRSTLIATGEHEYTRWGFRNYWTMKERRSCSPTSTGAEG